MTTEANKKIDTCKSFAFVVLISIREVELVWEEKI
jgi:hypothetical protein